MSDEERILEVVRRYVAAMRGGLRPDPEALAAEHPELGPPLRAALQAASTVAALSAARATRHVTLSLQPLPPTRYDRAAFVDRGGMGMVYRVHDASLGREVALKTLPPATTGPGSGGIGDGDAAEAAGRRQRDAARFRREAHLTAALEHPGVPPVYEVGASVDGTPYYTMRLLARDGRTLANELARAEGRRFEERAPLLEAFLRVCDTVAYAHSKGILHRDLKPENVVIGEYGVVFVVDWGLAAWREEGDGESEAPTLPAPSLPGAGHERPSGRLTEHGRILGTPGYHSPEAATGDMSCVDERSEVFSLGAMLFEVLTGTLPFPSTPRPDYAARILAEAPRDALAIDATIPRPLADLCRRALASSPSDRPPSVEALAAAIRTWRACSDADREALRRVAEAQAALGRAAGLKGHEARQAIERARAIVEAAPALATLGSEIEAVRAACAEATARLEREERERWQQQQARRRRRQLVVAAAGLLLLGAFALHRVERSRAQGREDAQRETLVARRTALRETLSQMDGIGLDTSGSDFELLLRLVRDANTDTVQAIAEELDGITEELASVRDRVRREPPIEGQSEAARIERAQLVELGTGRRRKSHLLCEALGHTHLAEVAAPALGRYLAAQYHSGGTVLAGAALARLVSAPTGGPEALATLRAVSELRGLDRDPEFRAGVLALLPTEAGATSADPRLVKPPPPPPRRPHGALSDPVVGSDWMVPAYVESWMGLGLPLDNRREVRGELEAFSQRIERTPDDAGGWLNRAEARRYAGDLSGAEADLTRAIELAPDDAVAWERRASVRRLCGNHRGSLADLDRALERTPDRARVLRFRGLTYVDLGDAARAITDLDAALAIDPGAGVALSYRAMARIGLLELEAAERDAMDATRAIPDVAEAWNVLAVARLLRRHPEAAAEAALTATRKGRDYYLGWNSLGVARWLSGDRGGARAAFREANLSDPRLPFAWSNLGLCDLAQGDPTSACRHLETAIERGGTRLPSAWLGLALARRASGDAARARHAMAVFRALAPEDPRGVDPEEPPNPKASPR